MIVIITFNNAELLQTQIDLFRRFVDKEVSIVDNSSNFETAKKIKVIAEKNGCEYLKTFFNEGDSSRSHGLACGVAYNWFRSKTKLLTLADHDIFPFKPYTFNKEFISGVPQIRGHYVYVWAGLVTVPTWIDASFMPCSVKGTNLDTGGELYKFETVHLKETYETTNGYTYSIIDDAFMHFSNLSNWRQEGNHGERIGNLMTVLNNKVNEGN